MQPVYVEKQSQPKKEKPLEISKPSSAGMPLFLQRAPLEVNEPGDIYEQEADRAADRVMRSSPPQIQRKSDSPRSQIATPSIVHEVLHAPGESLDANARGFMETRFGQDFSHVHVHTGAQATDSARAIQARAYTVGSDIVFGAGQYAPETHEGQKLIAHELTHVVQQQMNPNPHQIRRYGDPIPTVAQPTVTTMQQFINLVRRVEAANSGKTALEIAQMIMRAKYHSRGFDWLLPSSASTAGVAATGGVTSADVTTLSGEFTITLPQGGQSDPSHIIVAIVANAERSAPGAGMSAGLPGLAIQNPPSGLSQRDIATWVGDVASAAAEWMTAHPHPQGGTTMQNYLDEFSPESDMIADVDGLAMISTSAAAGFAFDSSASLSDNLQRFYFPTNPREGKNRRFHIFCLVEGLTLEPDGVSLSAGAIANINNRVQLNTNWFIANDPNLQTWMQIQTPPPPSPTMGGFGAGPPLGAGLFNPIPRQWVQRANDWQWFSQKFIDFVQRNLRAEGP